MRLVPFLDDPIHIHVSRGESSMRKPKKEHQIGNSTIIIHSPLVTMSAEQRGDWFKEEWEKGNSVLKEIAAAVENCYRD
jgi:hypothetical protein